MTKWSLESLSWREQKIFNWCNFFIKLVYFQIYLVSFWMIKSFKDFCFHNSQRAWEQKHFITVSVNRDKATAQPCNVGKMLQINWKWWCGNFGLLWQLLQGFGTCHQCWHSLHPDGASSSDKEPTCMTVGGTDCFLTLTTNCLSASLMFLKRVERETGKGRAARGKKGGRQVMQSNQDPSGSPGTTAYHQISGKCSRMFNSTLNLIKVIRNSWVFLLQSCFCRFSQTIFDLLVKTRQFCCPGWSIAINKKKKKNSQGDFLFTYVPLAHSSTCKNWTQSNVLSFPGGKAIFHQAHHRIKPSLI